jgi:hypothetical protein
MLVTFDGYQSGMRQLADKSWKISLDTQEMTGEQISHLVDFAGKFVKVMITDENVNNDMIEAFRDMEVMAEEGIKTPSQRFRNVLFVKWKDLKDQGMVQEPFESFYNHKYESLINQVKETLPQNE